MDGLQRVEALFSSLADADGVVQYAIMLEVMTTLGADAARAKVEVEGLLGAEGRKSLAEIVQGPVGQFLSSRHDEASNKLSKMEVAVAKVVAARSAPGAATTGTAAAGLLTCDVCGAPSKLKCSRCKGRRYCARQCQVRDWKRGGHREACTGSSGGGGGGIGGGGGEGGKATGGKKADAAETDSGAESAESTLAAAVAESAAESAAAENTESKNETAGATPTAAAVGGSGGEGGEWGEGSEGSEGSEQPPSVVMGSGGDGRGARGAQNPGAGAGGDRAAAGHCGFVDQMDPEVLAQLGFGGANPLALLEQDVQEERAALAALEAEEEGEGKTEGEVQGETQGEGGEGEVGGRGAIKETQEGVNGAPDTFAAAATVDAVDTNSVNNAAVAEEEKEAQLARDAAEEQESLAAVQALLVKEKLRRQKSDDGDSDGGGEGGGDGGDGGGNGDGGSSPLFTDDQAGIINQAIDKVRASSNQKSKRQQAEMEGGGGNEKGEGDDAGV